MANRYLRQFTSSFEPQVVNVFGRVTFGASGAPTLVTASSKGIKSISRVSAGKYTIVLGNPVNPVITDTYPSLLMVSRLFDETSGGVAPASPNMWLFSQTVSTNGTLTIVFDTGGTPTDPASGEAVYLNIVVKNSTAV